MYAEDKEFKEFVNKIGFKVADAMYQYKS